MTGDKGLLICENKNDMIWLNAGIFRETTMGEDFAACFRNFDDMGWNGMDAAALIEENQQAWQLAVVDQAENTVIYNLLLQKNGDVYLTYGYGSAENSGRTKLSSIRWVFKLAEGLEVVPMSDESSGVIDASLDEAIQAAVQQHYLPSKPDGLIHVESSKILSQQEMSGTPKVDQDDHMEKVIVYLLVLHESFRPDSESAQSIEKVGGDYIPTAVTFRLVDGEYLLEEYWEPRNGSHYIDDIKSKFPEEAAQQIWEDEKILNDLQQVNQKHIQALLQK